MTTMNFRMNNAVKKGIACMLALMLTALCSMAAADQAIRIGALKGATSMGLVKLLEDNDTGKSKNIYEFTMAAAADELTPLFLRGELDILAVPANLAAILYNKTGGEAELAAITTLGLLNIVEKGGTSVQTLEDLKGCTLLATGKGTTPEYVLTYLLAQHGLVLGTDVNVLWKSEPTEVIAAMSTMDSAFAMLPQPFVTAALGNVEGLRIALNLNDEWNHLDNGSIFVTAGLMVRREFAQQNPEKLAAFLHEYEESAAYVNEYPAEAAKLVEAAGIVKAPIAERAIPYCAIVYMDGEEMRSAARAYYEILFEQNPKAIGGTIPGDDFYAN